MSNPTITAIVYGEVIECPALKNALDDPSAIVFTVPARFEYTEVRVDGLVAQTTYFIKTSKVCNNDGCRHDEFVITCVKTLLYAFGILRRCLKCHDALGSNMIPRSVYTITYDAPELDTLIDDDPVYGAMSSDNARRCELFPPRTPLYRFTMSPTTQYTDCKFVSDACLAAYAPCVEPYATDLIQAPCGSGKSQFAVAAICSLANRNLLSRGVLCPVATRCQASAHAAIFSRAYSGYTVGQFHPSDLKMKTYDEFVGVEPNMKWTDYNLITTINSLIKRYTYYYDNKRCIHVPSLIWIDETNSLFSSLLLGSHINVIDGARVSIINALEEMIRRAAYVICTDAFLDQHVAQYIMSLRGMVGPARSIAFTQRFRRNNMIMHKHTTKCEEDVIKEAVHQLIAGRRIIIYCDSKACVDCIVI